MKCGCGMMKTIENYKDYERVMCFLKGLGETYNIVKTQILLMKPLPGINRVFSLVLQQERHLNESMGIYTKVLINSANQQRTKPTTVIMGGATMEEEEGKTMESNVLSAIR